MEMRRLLTTALLVLGFGIAQAQVRGTPASVTSLAPGRPIGGPPASVTSLGPLGFGLPGDNVFFGSQFPTTGSFFNGVHNTKIAPPFFFDRFRHRRPLGVGPGGPFGFGNGLPYGFGYGGYGYPAYGYGYGYGVPYLMYDSGQSVPTELPSQSATGQPQEMMAPPEAPGPTVFDSHGSPGGYALVPAPRVQQSAAAQPAPAPAAVAQPAPPPEPQVKTVLVFRDGRQLEVTNYAIADGNLLNLSGPGPRRIALSELNLQATEQANADRGVEFSVPKS